MSATVAPVATCDRHDFPGPGIAAARINNIQLGEYGRNRTNVGEGDWISIEGGRGTVHLGRGQMAVDRPQAQLAEIERWRVSVQGPPMANFTAGCVSPVGEDDLQTFPGS